MQTLNDLVPKTVDKTVDKTVEKTVKMAKTAKITLENHWLLDPVRTVILASTGPTAWILAMMGALVVLRYGLNCMIGWYNARVRRAEQHYIRMQEQVAKEDARPRWYRHKRRRLNQRF